MERLIKHSDIPAILWDNSNHLLYLPPILSEVWKRLLVKNQLLEKALTKAPEGFVGGMSKEETDNHFAWKFNGSCARVILSLLDPKKDLDIIADVYVKFFSGGKVCLVDLPCGSGAAAVSLLITVAELRKLDIIPRIDLEVTIIGGEISRFAQAYAIDFLKEIEIDLQEQAISIKYHIVDWDVCDSISNSDLTKQITLLSQGCSTKLLIMANFSDFLQKKSKWKEAEPQISELFRHSRDESSVAIWIEPCTNSVKESFVGRAIGWFRKQFKALFTKNPSYLEMNVAAESSCRTHHSLRHDTFRTNLAIMRFDLPLGGSDEA